MQCPYCLRNETKVVDKRDGDNFATRRRRQCIKCGKRFTTYERLGNVDLSVIKKDGRRELFSREKLKNGFIKACEKRPVSVEKIEQVVDEIEKELRNKESTEIKGTVIGEIVMKKLKKLDKVAYIRFASVYREFTDLSDFQKELKTLLPR